MSLTDIMSAAGLASWTELALIVCFITFSAIVFWVFVVRRTPSYDHMRRLPLDNGDDVVSREATKGGGAS